jgi:hypothetical protein
MSWSTSFLESVVKHASAMLTVIPLDNGNPCRDNKSTYDGSLNGIVAGVVCVLAVVAPEDCVQLRLGSVSHK